MKFGFVAGMSYYYSYLINQQLSAHVQNIPITEMLKGILGNVDN